MEIASVVLLIGLGLFCFETSKLMFSLIDALVVGTRFGVLSFQLTVEG